MSQKIMNSIIYLTWQQISCWQTIPLLTFLRYAYVADMATVDERAAHNISSYITPENEMSKLNDAEQRQNRIIFFFKTNEMFKKRIIM